ncbi:Oxidoreductase OS=Streptomyces tendae OX=1932 GN=GUR47_12235 PE=4 SV=1 [Streptomyces tendae]
MWQAFRNGSVYDLSSGDALVDDPHGPRPLVLVADRAWAWWCRRLLLDGPPALAGRVSSLQLGVCGSATRWIWRAARWCPTSSCGAAASTGRCCCRRPGSRPCGWWTARCRASKRPACTPRATCICRASRFPGGIRLTDAQIGTDLMLNQAIVHRDRSGRSIAADGLTVGQDLQAEMLESHREASLRSAQVGVSLLSLRGALLAAHLVHAALGAERPAADGGAHLVPDPGGPPAARCCGAPPPPRAPVSSASSARAGCASTTGGSATPWT